MAKKIAAYNEQQRRISDNTAKKVMKKQQEETAKNVVEFTAVSPSEPEPEEVEAFRKALADVDAKIAKEKAIIEEDDVKIEDKIKLASDEMARRGRRNARADDRAEVLAKVKAEVKAETDRKAKEKADKKAELDAMTSDELNAEIDQMTSFMAETYKKLEAIKAQKLAEIERLKKEAKKKAAAEEKARLEAEAEKARKTKEAAEAKKKAEEAKAAQEAKSVQARLVQARALQQASPVPPQQSPITGLRMPTAFSPSVVGYTGPSKVYRYYDHTIRAYNLTSDLWVADQAAPNAWKAIWVWRENGEIHHQMTNEELREYFPA